MENTKIKLQGGSDIQDKTCLMCERTYKSVQQLCGNCFKRLKDMKASESGSTDKGLFEIIQLSKARDRNNSALKLVNKKNPDYQKLKETNQRLKKENKTLYDSQRYQTSKKSARAALGFKAKTEEEESKSALSLR